jgi:hypothetical protein
MLIRVNPPRVRRHTEPPSHYCRCGNPVSSSGGTCVNCGGMIDNQS